MPDIMQEVTSADKAYAWMQEHDVPIVRRVVRTVWKEVGEALEWKPLIDRLPPHYRIPRRMTVDVETKLRGPYFVKLKVTGTTFEGVPGYTRNPTMYSKTQLTTLDIEGAIPDLVGECLPEVDPETVNFVIEGVYHRRGGEW